MITFAPRRSALVPVLAALSATMLLPSLGTSIANVALPAMAAAFDAPFSRVQGVVVAYLLAVTVLIVIAGRLGDLLGRRRLLIAGVLLFTVATLLCGLAPTLPVLIAARALQGAGAAGMMAMTMALVGETVPEARTGSAMGLLGTMSAVGTALGPSLGGVLVEALGWQAVFLAVAPFGVVTLVLTAHTLPRPAVPAASPGRRSPLLDLTLLRDPALAVGLITTALVSTVMMSTLVVGPFHLSAALGLSAALVGLVMSAGPAVAALTGVPAGRATDRFGARAMVVTGLASVIAGASVLSVMPASAGVAGYVLPLVVVTAGYAVFQAATNTMVMRHAAADRRGLVSGLLNLSRNVGLMSGASVMGAVFAAAGTGDVTGAAPADVVRGTHATFVVAAVLVSLGLGLVLITTRRPGGPGPGTPRRSRA
ncbi:MFS transporter [Micromonospora sp. NPDC005220]|uniref:MFS transporter n=1 Tax=Micromonospora sp. NPDC005220 TaxID=3155589 RepID=UPI0033B1822B